MGKEQDDLKEKCQPCCGPKMPRGYPEKEIRDYERYDTPLKGN